MSKWREWLVGTALGRLVGGVLLALLGMVAGELTPLPEVLGVSGGAQVELRQSD